METPKLIECEIGLTLNEVESRLARVRHAIPIRFRSQILMVGIDFIGTGIAVAPDRTRIEVKRIELVGTLSVNPDLTEESIVEATVKWLRENAKAEKFEETLVLP